MQFHPESVATEFGIAVLQNFRDITLRHLGLPPAPSLLLDVRGEITCRQSVPCCAAPTCWHTHVHSDFDCMAAGIFLHILCGTMAAALLCETKRRRSFNPFENLAARAGPPGSCMPPAPWSSSGGEALDVRWRRLPGLLAASGGSAAIFEALHGGEPLADTFWLDR